MLKIYTGPDGRISSLGYTPAREPFQWTFPRLVLGSIAGVVGLLAFGAFPLTSVALSLPTALLILWLMDRAAEKASLHLPVREHDLVTVATLFADMPNDASRLPPFPDDADQQQCMLWVEQANIALRQIRLEGAQRTIRSHADRSASDSRTQTGDLA